MNEKSMMQQGIDTVRSMYETSGGLSWDLVGHVVLAIVVIALAAYVGKNAKNFKDKL